MFYDPNCPFRNEKRCGLAELGPRFTLRLRSLQKGTFDSKYGEFEFELRRKEMDSEGHGYSKKKFFRQKVSRCIQHGWLSA